MKFTRLRLSGFKSFVEPTEMVIERGLTGIVGPNGCGKSNLLEALRWVMGENSFKNMRASGMDDVIFSGTANRPSRNMAEVTIALDNGSRTAPTAFNDQETIEIARRIEREAGSAYRINGRDVRARDVQLLFADASTGARSPALVRQGQIGELINAKPQARRRILEEAAGITGLHTRRHEAELKLNGGGNQSPAHRRRGRPTRKPTCRFETPGPPGCKVQARCRRNPQAGGRPGYTANGSRRATQPSREQTQLEAITRVLAEHTRVVSETTRGREAASDALPQLREAATTQAAALQRLILARQSLDEEEARLKSRQAETQAHLADAERDLAREQERLGDAIAILADSTRKKHRCSRAGKRGRTPARCAIANWSSPPMASLSPRNRPNG